MRTIESESAVDVRGRFELEKNPGSDREITPEFTTDRPASHTLTHLTQPIQIIYICTASKYVITGNNKK